MLCHGVNGSGKNLPILDAVFDRCEGIAATIEPIHFNDRLSATTAIHGCSHSQRLPALIAAGRTFRGFLLLLFPLWQNAHVTVALGHFRPKEKAKCLVYTLKGQDRKRLHNTLSPCMLSSYNHYYCSEWYSEIQFRQSFGLNRETNDTSQTTQTSPCVQVLMCIGHFCILKQVYWQE